MRSSPPLIHRTLKTNVFTPFFFFFVFPDPNLPLFHSLTGSRDEGGGWTGCRGNGLLSYRGADEQTTDYELGKTSVSGASEQRLMCLGEFRIFCAVTVELDMSGTKPRE